MSEKPWTKPDLLTSNDLLFAHGCLCDYARNTIIPTEHHANRLRDVLNNFQRELKEHLMPGAPSFQVIVGRGGYLVKPVGGW